MLRKIGRVIKTWWKLTVAMYAWYGLTDVVKGNVNTYVNRVLIKYNGTDEELKEFDSKTRWVILPQLIFDNIKETVDSFKRLVEGL